MLATLPADGDEQIVSGGGDRSIYFRDPGGNMVEAWDFFHRGEGERDGVEALR